MSEDDTTPAQSNRLEANSLILLSEFKRHETCKSKIAKVLQHPHQHGRLAAAGGTGQKQVLEVSE